jgi:hypothetical protein
MILDGFWPSRGIRVVSGAFLFLDMLLLLFCNRCFFIVCLTMLAPCWPPFLDHFGDQSSKKGTVELKEGTFLKRSYQNDAQWSQKAPKWCPKRPQRLQNDAQRDPQVPKMLLDLGPNFHRLFEWKKSRDEFWPPKLINDFLPFECKTTRDEFWRPKLITLFLRRLGSNSRRRN